MSFFDFFFVINFGNQKKCCIFAAVSKRVGNKQPKQLTNNLAEKAASKATTTMNRTKTKQSTNNNKVIADSNYIKSNSIECVRLNVFNNATYKKLLACGEGIAERQKAAQNLVDYLCKRFGIVSVPVKVKNTPQPHSINVAGKTTAKLLGNYQHLGMSIPLNINIWNCTAVRNQVISIKVFAGVLLHEFMHHYDIHCIGLNKTIHCAGFYKRISDLERKLSV